MNVHLHTLLLANSFIAVILSVMMNLFAWQKKSYKGFRTISLSYILFSLALILRIYFDPLSGAASAILANSLVALSFLVMYSGIQQFRELRPCLVGFNAVIVFIVIFSSWYFASILPSTQYRTVISSFLFTLQCALCIWAVGRQSNGAWTLCQKIVGLSFLILIFGMTARIYITMQAPPPANFLESDSTQSLFFFVSIFFILSTSLGFIWGTIHKSEIELHTLANSLRESLAEKEAIAAERETNHTFLNILLNTIPVPVFYKDKNGLYQNVNDAFCKTTGKEKQQIIGHRNVEVRGDENVSKSVEHDRIILETGEMQSYEDSILFGDGLHHQVMVNKNALIDQNGKVIGIVGTLTDITERKIREAKIRFLAHHDSLTGLFNRSYFYDQLGLAISKAKRSEGYISLLFIDLDNFKIINDTLGHHAGDVMLKTVGNRLLSITRDYDIVCRLGGDEFAVLLVDLGDRPALIGIAEKVLTSLSAPISYQTTEHSISASIGISIYPKNSTSNEELVQMADKAMYYAKLEGRNRYKFFHDIPNDVSRFNQHP